MGEPLHTLIVEDSEDDALLLVGELEQGGYQVTAQRVDTLKAVRDALAKQTWDIIFSDYTMPQFSGTEALELVRRSGLDIPFIFVSGTIGEDNAAAAMKAGAQDYILKGNLKRLLPAVERELREAEIRRHRRLAEKKLQRQQERIHALHEVGLAINSALDLHAISNLLLEKIDSLLPCSAAATLTLFNQDIGKIEPVACRHLDEGEWKAAMIREPWALIQVAFACRTYVMVRNAQIEPLTLEPPELLRKYGLVSYLGVPLIARDDVLGLLSFYTKEEHRFSKEETDFFMALASQAAMAIHNCQLYEQTKSQAEELAKVNSELEKSSKDKDESLNIISHELRTPLHGIKAYLQMLQEGSFGEVSSLQEEALRKVVCLSNDLSTMINSILQVGSLDSGEVKIERQRVSLVDFFEELKSAYEGDIDKEVSLNWLCPSGLPVITTDRCKLKHILQNLINNAIKFTEEGRVIVSAKQVDGNRH